MHSCLHALAHVHERRYAGDRASPLMQHTSLDFHWAIAMDGAIHEADVHVRADNAAERGVPLPEGWHVALSASDLGSFAVAAGRSLEISM